MSKIRPNLALQRTPHRRGAHCGIIAYLGGASPLSFGVRRRSCRVGWASAYIQKLRDGEAVAFRPRGNSMAGKVESGQLCTVEPVDPATLRVGDIVLCKVNGREYLHLVKAIQGQRFQIGNNRGRINGWVSAGAIFGRCVRVES